MQSSAVWWIAVATLGTLALGGCAAGAPGSAAGSEPEPTATPDQTADTREESREAARERARLDELYRARIDSARLHFTEADVRFMTGMIHHHAQALVMVGMVDGSGASPAIRRLAARIDNAQRDEIATMQRWLQDRDQPVVRVGPGGEVEAPAGAHGGHARPGQHAEHGDSLMPGMLSDAELRELEAARGPDFDRLFLQYMIRHHQGAVTMVQELFATDGAGQDEDVFRLASDVQVDQKTEIDRMERMLESMGTSGPSS